MNKYLIFLLTGLFCVLFVACSHSENVEKETESIGVEENAFVWQPSFMNDCGSASTNRSGFGIIDGKNDILYYQAASIENDTMYSLYSYDENTNKSEELAPDCFGMIILT